MESLWQSEVSLRFPPCPTASTQHADVAIVGAGLGGSWLAYWLKDSGLRVILVDAGQPASGASGRNAGFLLGGTAELYSAVVDRMGRNAAQSLLALSQSNREIVQQLAEAAPGGFLYQPSGSYYLSGPHEAEAVYRTVSLLQADGEPAQLVESRHLPTSLRRLDMTPAAYFPKDGALHPVQLVSLLLSQACEAGVAVYGNTPITRIVDGEGHVDLITRHGLIQARQVVLTANAWLPQIAPALKDHVVPVRGQVLATAPLPPLLDAPAYADEGYLYWRQRPDGVLIVGGYRNLAPDDETGYALSLHPVIQGALERLARRIAGESVTVTHRWAGTMAFTPDRLPLVGALRPRILVAGGYSGHGVALTGAVGRLVARHLTDGTPLNPWLAPDRFASRT